MKNWKPVIFCFGLIFISISIIVAFTLSKQDKIIEKIKKLKLELALDEEAFERSEQGITDKMNIGDEVETNRLHQMLFEGDKITGIIVKSLGYPSTDGYERVELDNGMQFTTKYLQLRKGTE